MPQTTTSDRKKTSAARTSGKSTKTDSKSKTSNANGSASSANGTSSKSNTKLVAGVAAGLAAAGAAGYAAYRTLRKDEERTTYHVLPHEKGWQVKVEGSERASSTHETKKEALEVARELVRSKEPSQLVIHGSDGKVQKAHTYGEDEEAEAN